MRFGSPVGKTMVGLDRVPRMFFETVSDRESYQNVETASYRALLRRFCV